MAKGRDGGSLPEREKERECGKTHHKFTCLFPVHKGTRDGIGSEDLIPKEQQKIQEGKGIERERERERDVCESHRVA